MTHVVPHVVGAWHLRGRARSRRVHDHLARHAPEPVPPLDPGERVLTRAGEPDTTVVGTTAAFYLRSADDRWHRTAWSEIATIGWSTLDHCLQVRTWSTSSTGPALRFTADRRFAAFAAERVCATRLLCTRAEILPGILATVLAVRAGHADDVQWRIAVDRADRVADSALREASARIIAELRGLTGC